MPPTTRRPLLPKVLPPKLGRVLARPSLGKGLLDAVKEGAAWVQAPGGSGKTTAVAALAADLGLPLAWLHADAGDIQLASFFHYLSLAIAGARPRSSVALPVYGAEPEAQAELFARRFARAAIESGKERDLVLVIDNLQDIPADSRVHAAIAALCEEFAGTWKIFLLNREPPGPAYTRLLGQGRLVAVAPEQFAFTQAELRDAMRQRGIADEERLDALWRESQGWIAGALMLSMGTGTPTLPGATAKGRSTVALFAYFAAQVFGRLDDADRRLLLATAFLTTISPGAAVRLSAIADADRRLEQRATEGLLTSRMQGAPARYRHHDLFRDFLRDLAAKSFPAAALVDLKRRSADELGASEDPLAALELLGEIGDWSRLQGVLVANAEALLNRGHFRQIVALAEGIPAETRDGDPWFLYWLGQSQQGLNDGAAYETLDRAWHLFEARGDRAGQFAIASGMTAIIRQHLRHQDIIGSWVERAMSVADSIDAIASPFIALKATAGLLGTMQYGRAITGDPRPVIAKVLELVERVQDPNLCLHALTQVVGMAWRLRLPEVVEPVVAIANARALVARVSPLVNLHWLFDLIAYDCVLGDRRRAVANAPKCEPLAVATGQPIARFLALLSDLEVACDSNDVPLSRRLLARLAEQVDPARPLTAGYYAGFAARVALIEDKAPEALAEALRAIGILSDSGLPPVQTHAYFAVEAGALAAAGKYDEAIACCARWRPDFAPHHQTVVDIYSAWIEAARALDAGEEGAREALRVAIAATREGRFPHGLRHVNVLSSRLLERAWAWGIERDYVARMVVQGALRPPDLESPHWPWPLRVRCMGAFEIARPDGVVSAPGRNQKTVELLQVVIAMGGSAPIDRIIALLWPGEGRVGAQHALETAVYRLRKLLDSDACITMADRQVALVRSEIWVDALALSALFAKLDAGAAPPGEEAIRRVAELHAGPFLPHRQQEPWAAEFRERLWMRVRRLMVGAARRAREKGDAEQAERLLFFVIDRQSVAEEAFAELMRLYLGLGQPGEALHAYRRCAAALASEMGLEPGAELRALAAEIGSRSPASGKP